MLYARGSPVHFAHKPAPAWTRKDRWQAYMKNVYNKDVSGIINKGIHCKQQAVCSVTK